MKTKHTPLLLFLTLACVAPAAVSAQILKLPTTWGGDRSSRVRFSWSNKDRYSLQQDPSNLAACRLQTRFSRPGVLASVGASDAHPISRLSA
jgi:hypothetical protein